MTTHLNTLAKKLLHISFEELSNREQHIVKRIAEGMHISRDTNREFDQQLTFGQRLSDRVATFGGSWPFILLFGVFLLGWTVLNTFILAKQAFDPYPYIFLNLFLSMLAAIQAPIIMMSQNRQAVRDRLNAAQDYDVNLKAELEIMSLHQKIDGLRQEQWQDLLDMQQKQISILTQLLSKDEGQERRKE